MKLSTWTYSIMSSMAMWDWLWHGLFGCYSKAIEWTVCSGREWFKWNDIDNWVLNGPQGFCHREETRNNPGRITATVESMKESVRSSWMSWPVHSIWPPDSSRKDTIQGWLHDHSKSHRLMSSSSLSSHTDVSVKVVSPRVRRYVCKSSSSSFVFGSNSWRRRLHFLS